jgi:hypothetical protein
MTSDDRKQDASVSQPGEAKALPEQKMPPAAGAHAASHLVNEDATPGSGILSSGPHSAGREVDSGAG